MIEPFTHIQIKGHDFRLGGELAQVLMTSLIETYKQNGGKNFLTMTFADEGHRYAVTIEDCTKSLSPAEKLSQLERKNAELTARLQLVKKDRDEMYEFVGEQQDRIRELEEAVGTLSFLDEQSATLQEVKNAIYQHVLEEDEEE